MTSFEHIDIVIPSRGTPLGLWATVAACEVQLEPQDINYKYTIVLNGEEKLDNDTQNMVLFLERSDKINEVVVQQSELSPPQARQLGFNKSSGKYVFFMDNHVIPCSGYFERSIADFEHFNIDTLHSCYQYYLRDTVHYHYKLKLKHNFWGESGPQPGDKVRPHRIAAGGHGGFMVKRTSWEAMGGYGPDGLFQGYAGEEMYADLKAWLLGYSVWIDPKIKHFHYAGKRPYARHRSEGFFINLMVCANVIGGVDWMNTVYESFSNRSKWIMPLGNRDMYELMIIAYERSAAHSAELATKRTKTLDELLDWFLTECIPC